MTQFSANPKPFGVIGLVIVILSFMFSLVPCVGFYAIGPCIIGLIFSAISYSNENDQKRRSGVPLAGLIIGGLAICLSLYQYYNYKTVYDTKSEIVNSLKDLEQRTEGEGMNGILEEVFQEIEEEIADTGVTLDTTNSNTLDSIEIMTLDTIQ